MLFISLDFLILYMAHLDYTINKSKVWYYKKYNHNNSVMSFCDWTWLKSLYYVTYLYINN